MPLTDEQKRSIIQENRQIISQLQERASFIGPREKRKPSFSDVLRSPDPFKTGLEALGVPGGLQKEAIAAKGFVTFPYDLMKDIVLPTYKGTAKALYALPTKGLGVAQKVVKEEVRPHQQQAIQMAKAFGGGVLDWLKMSLLPDTPAGIVAKQRIGDRIKESGYLAEAVHPAVLLGLVKGGTKFATKKPTALKTRLEALRAEPEVGLPRKVVQERLQALRETPEPVRAEMQPILDQILKPSERVGLEPLQIPKRTTVIPERLPPDFVLGKEGRLMRTTKKRPVKVPEEGIELRPGERKGPLYEKPKVEKPTAIHYGKVLGEKPTGAKLILPSGVERPSPVVKRPYFETKILEGKKAPPKEIILQTKAKTARTRLMQQLSSIDGEIVRVGKKNPKVYHNSPTGWVEYRTKKPVSPRFTEILDDFVRPESKIEVVGFKAKLDLAEQKALDRIKKRGTRLTTGIDPAEMADLAIIGAAKIARGTIKFTEWSAEMVREYGARIKPYLKQIYARSQKGVPRLKANAELDSFLDYFEDIQAPVGFRPPRKPARAAIRERLREEGLRGKELTQAANAEFIVEVNRYGIALRKTKGGKVTPAIREAGTYVPEDFATYGKFKDAKAGIFGGTKDATRFIQEIDGALSVEAKAKLPSQGGPAERYVLHRTRDIVKSKLTWTNAMKSRLATITKGTSKEQLQTANQVIEHISREGAYVDPAKLVTNPKISALTTDVKVVRLAQEGRKLYESLLRHQNEFRRLIGREEIPHRDYYTAHSIHETTIWERALGHNKTPKQAIGPGLPDYIKPNAAFNPRAMAREVGLPETVREMNLQTLLERYIETAGKDIYNTSIIQNNKAFIQQLESMGYKHAARGLENWTAEAFGGVKGAIDRAANLSPTIHKGMSRFRQGLIRSVFPLNFAWNTFVQTSSGVLTYARYGNRNSIRGLYDWFGSKKIRQEIRDNAYSAIIKSQRSGRISRQDINRGVGAAQRLSRGKLEKASDAANFFTEWVERHLTGWSVATAKRHGAAKGLKGKALWEYASDGGAKTQSMYNLEDLPGMLRSELIKTGGPFQTFSFEVFNTAREIAGKTGTPPATQAIRIKMLLRFLAGATAVNYIGQAAIGRKPWELSSFIPFYGAFIAPVSAALRGEDVSMTTTRGLPSPVGIAIKGGQAVHKGLLKPGMAATKELIRTGNANEALEEFMATGRWDKLRRFTIRYLSGFMGVPGGTQMNRVVDGLIAVSAGGMVDSAGKLMFPITDTKDKMRTFLAGPWASKGGQEYWDKRGKELDLYIESLNENPLLRDVVESLPVVSDVYKFGPDSPAIRGFDAFHGRVERKVTRAKELDTREKKLKYIQENKEFFRVVGHKPNGEPIRLPQALKKIDSRISKYRKQIRDIESGTVMVDKKPVKLTEKQQRRAISNLRQKIEKLAKDALKLKKGRSE